jgi:phospholipase C
MRASLLRIASALAILAGTGLAAAASTTGAAPEAAAATAPCGTLTAAPAYSHVIWILMENHSLGDIIGNTAQAPYLNSVAKECGLATNYHNLSHPSLPNYVGMTSGLATLKAFNSDCNPSKKCSTSAPSIFGQGETWKAYEESMPANCAPANSGEYAVRHNPPPYFPALAASCATLDVPYSQLATDLGNNTLPAFSFITPNLIDDMHDGTIAQGDSWLAANLPTILASTEYTSGTTAVFITWDEGTGGKTGESCATNTTDPSCLVATIVVSPSTVPGTKSGTLFNHYSLLATAEQLLKVPALGQAATASSMTAAFNL